MVKTTVVVAGLTAALCLAPAANGDASSADASFYQALNRAGITVTNPQGMSAQGHQVCADLLAGVPWRTVITKLMSVAGYTQAESFTILASSTGNYCPGYHSTEAPYRPGEKFVA
ncbi:conserved secreted protein [Mycobacteroides abscessus subsp. abscessus]|nr:conserved secreted protein [Mycobacteroides abscessus subsp. abscessus]